MGKLLDFTFKSCEETGAIFNINADYYKLFLNMSDKDMEAIIFCIMCDQAKSINRAISSNRLKHTNDIVEDIKTILRLMAYGITGFKEGSGELVVNKPAGAFPPDKETAKKLDEKIDNSTSLIRKILKHWITREGIRTPTKEELLARKEYLEYFMRAGGD